MNYKLNLLETRVNQLQTLCDRQEGMLKRVYAFMKQCERQGMVPEGWTTDPGNGGSSFRPFGGPSGAAKPDELLLRQARAYANASPARSPSTVSNNNNETFSSVKQEEEEELRALKRQRGLERVVQTARDAETRHESNVVGHMVEDK